MKRGCKSFYLMLFVHFFTCAAVANTDVISNREEIPKGRFSGQEVVGARVVAESSDRAPLEQSSEEVSRSGKSFKPSKGERPDHKTSNVSGEAKEEEIVAEEGESDKKQTLIDAALDFYQASQELWARGEFEGAINALDEAYALILKVHNDSEPTMVQQKEDLRILISKRLIEIYASRYTAVNGTHQAIPLTMNDNVHYEIKQFQTVEREFFVNAYKRSGRYIQMIVKELNETGLPEELAWLPLVESGFKVRALSPARALGLWQFIASTGYKFGLKRDDWIDERLDPEKSTRSAIAYLRELHRIFGDWATVLAAYNCGEENVLRVIREQRINYLDNFWDLYERLPRETARYVPRFLATLHILKEPPKYGFDLGEAEQPLSFEVVTIEKQVRLDAIAKALGIPEGLLFDLNPELRLQVTPPTPYALRIPPATSDRVLASLGSIPEWSHVRIGRLTYVYHRVRKGETLSSIAERYKTSVAAISKANNIRNRQFIKAGQRLKIPLHGGTVRASR